MCLCQHFQSLVNIFTTIQSTTHRCPIVGLLLLTHTNTGTHASYHVKPGFSTTDSYTKEALYEHISRVPEAASFGVLVHSERLLLCNNTHILICVPNAPNNYRAKQTHYIKP